MGCRPANPRAFNESDFFPKLAYERVSSIALFSGGPTMPGTVRLHRVLTTKPEKIYRAFTESDAMAKWLPPNGFTCTVHQFEAKVGGGFKMSFRNFTPGNSHSFGGKYLELSPGESLRYT